MLVSALAIASAAMGPIFLKSADAALLASAVATSPPGEANLTVITNGGASTLRRLERAAHAAQTISSGALEPPSYLEIAGGRLSRAGQGFDADLLAKTGVCGRVRIVVGHCPTTTGDVLISERSLLKAKLQVGERFSFGASSGSGSETLRIVGVYLQPVSTNDAYWSGNDYFDYSAPTSLSGAFFQLDPFIGSPATVMGAGAFSPPALQATIAWRPQALDAGTAPVTALLATVRQLFFRRYAFEVSTQLPEIVASAQHNADLVRTVVLAVLLQLVLLSLLVLYGLGRTTARARALETAFARRRGFPRRALFGLALAEPTVLIAAAFPLGVLLAWGILQLLSPTLFGGGIAVSVSAGAIAAGAASAAAALVASALATYELWRGRGADEHRRERAALALDAFAVALALAGLVTLATNGALRRGVDDPLAAIAPGLLAVGVGVIGLRLAAVAVKGAIAATRGSPHLATFLALRQVGRHPATLRRVLPLTLATALVLFAVASFALASSERSTLADFEVGAARVYDVSVPSGADLTSEVRRADPSGRQAMAAIVYRSTSETLLAVDASRFAAVASWPASVSRRSAAQVARSLAPPAPPGVTFAGGTLDLRLGESPSAPPMGLSLTVFDNSSQTTETLAIVLRHGVHDYAVGLLGDCAAGCRLLRFNPYSLDSSVPPGPKVELAVLGITAAAADGESTVPFGAGRSGSWSAQPAAIGVGTARGGVTFSLPRSLLGFGGLQLTPVDLPAAIPAVVTDTFAALNNPSPPNAEVSIEGLDGNQLTAAAVLEVPSLPGVGTDAVLIDLPLAERALAAPMTDTTDQVWLSPTASAAVLRRLDALGVRFGPELTAAGRAAAFGRGGLSLAYDLALVVSSMALALALGAVTFEIAAEGRSRRREIDALELAGVGLRHARRAVLVENAAVLALALAVGGAIGFGADALTLGSLPVFSSGTDGLALAGGVAPLPLLAALGAVAVVLVVAALVTTRLVVRQHRASGVWTPA